MSASRKVRPVVADPIGATLVARIGPQHGLRSKALPTILVGRERERQAKVGPVKPQLAAAGLLGTRREKTPPIPGPIGRSLKSMETDSRKQILSLSSHPRRSRAKHLSLL